MNGLNNLIIKLRESVEADTFVRLTLSKPQNKQSDLKKVIIKLATIKKALHFSFTYRHQTKDITKNQLLKDGYLTIEELMNQQFYILNLFTIKEDVNLEVKSNGTEKIRSTKPTFKKLPEKSHDKIKNRLIKGTNYLQELGVLNAKGGIQKDKGDKYKQINKFIEIIDGLIKQNKTLVDQKEIKVVDMGAGKGYLTFALYDYLVNTLKTTASVKGIEIRSDLIEKCNAIAQKVDFEQLLFEKGFISDYDLTETDVLIALHACDTATDDAIFKGIQANAQLIICAPCCHKQIRKEMKNSKHLQPILDYGILKERQAEMLTDVIRALLLELSGYKTKVFEFISTEHTGKNVMIVGQKHGHQVKEEEIYQKIAILKEEFGIRRHYLETLLSTGNFNSSSIENLN